MTWRRVRAEMAIGTMLAGLVAIPWHWWLGLLLVVAGRLTLAKWGF